MPAVFVHGVPDTYELWKHVRDRLDRTDIIALALPGFDNPPPAGFSGTKEEYADWIIAEIEKIGEPVDLVGHDWGCILTARVASLRPDLVRTWAGISGPIDRDYEWHEFAKIWQKPGEGERWFAELDPNAYAANLIDQGIPENDARRAVDFLDDVQKANILALYRSAVDLGKDWEPGLDQLTAPALVMWGLDDPYLPNHFADSLGQATRARAVVKLRAGHWVPLDAPDDVARELTTHWGGAPIRRQPLSIGEAALLD